MDADIGLSIATERNVELIQGAGEFSTPLGAAGQDQILMVDYMVDYINPDFSNKLW